MTRVEDARGVTRGGVWLVAQGEDARGVTRVVARLGVWPAARGVVWPAAGRIEPGSVCGDRSVAVDPRGREVDHQIDDHAEPRGS